MSNPSWRQHTLPASTNPEVARLLCQSAGLKPDDILLDPFCGCATIPIIALTEYKIKQAFASDVSGRAIDAAIKNRQLAGLSDHQLTIFRSNISMIKLSPKTIDHIITNLPFGIRTGDHQKNIQSYQALCRKSLSLLKLDGTITILTQEKKLLVQIFSPLFHIKKIRTIDLGGLSPDIFQLTIKKPQKT